MARLALFLLMIATICLMLLLSACSQETQRLDANRKGQELDSLIEALNHQRNLNPENPTPYQDLGRAYHEKAGYEIKRIWARTDSRLTSAQDKIRRLLAYSRSNYEQALRLDSTSASCCIAIGLSYELEWQWLDNEQEGDYWWEYQYSPDLTINWLVRWYFKEHRRYPEEIARARSFFRRAIELQPENADAWFHLGQVTGDNDERIALLRKVLSINKDYAKAYVALMDFRGPSGILPNREEYLQLYVRAKALLQGDPERLILSPFGAEETYYETIRHVPSVAKLFYWPGLIALQRSTYFLDVMHFYELKLEKEPYNTRVLHMLCSYKSTFAEHVVIPFRRTVRTKEALVAYDELLRLSEYEVRLDRSPYRSLKQPFPDSYWMCLNIASGIPDAKEAASLLRRAIALDSVRAIGHYLLGFTLFSIGELGNAEKSLLTADRVWPEDRYARLRANQLLTLLYLKQGNFTSAMKSFEVASTLDPLDTRHVLKRGLSRRGGAMDFSTDSILTLKNQNGQRERKFIAAMCLANGWARYYMNYGKNEAEALSWAEKATEFYPQDAAAHLDFADFCMFTDRRAERPSALRQAIKCAPSNLQTYLDLALELSPTYSSKESIELLKKAAQLGSYSAKEILETTGKKEQMK